ncbi:ABC transporter ATP-binding protein [Hwanghaeella sp.]|uniref:ABC transporter ATP-binding protein n=1 Tax=Hwanghaeella sp. TaxID=2605943 RepID=UPI003CCC39F7
MTSNGKSISLRKITKAWADPPAVDGVDLEIPAGQFTALLGPSGCGKSTTLRIIAGLEYPDSGAVVIGDQDVTSLPPAKRNIAMVFQSYALFPHLSVAENITFGLRTRRVPQTERTDRLSRVADLLELTPYLDRKPSQLSGGQQQRVALGRAIIAERPVCLMDEPLSNLDARLRHEMRSEIRALQQKLGFTMVYVTHDQVEAITMADQVALMNKGHVEQAASPREIYERPATVFAARFIGTPPMNLIPAAAFGAKAGGLASRDFLIGIRPEVMTLSQGGPMEATVVEAEFLGSETLVTCQAGDSRFVVSAPGGMSINRGEAVTIGFKPENMHLFDGETGARCDGELNSVAAALCGKQ